MTESSNPQDVGYWVVSDRLAARYTSALTWRRIREIPANVKLFNVWAVFDNRGDGVVCCNAAPLEIELPQCHAAFCQQVHQRCAERTRERLREADR